jgi:hypothetical protein
MTLAHWFTQYDPGGFPVEKAALGACDLSVLHVGGEWQWLVRRDGRDVAEGSARAALDAQQQARSRGAQAWLITPCNCGTGGPCA